MTAHQIKKQLAKKFDVSMKTFSVRISNAIWIYIQNESDESIDTIDVQNYVARDLGQEIVQYCTVTGEILGGGNRLVLCQHAI